MPTRPYEVVVTAGGRSRRFGSDKLDLLLDRTLEALPPDVRVVCVGPSRPTSRAVAWTVEAAAGGGPLAAVAAGLAATEAPVVVVAGGDMPRVGAAVPALVAALSAADPAVAAVLVDRSGRPQPLATAWRRAALEQRLSALDHDGGLADRPLRLLLADVATVPVPDSWGSSWDVDTPEDLSAPRP